MTTRIYVRILGGVSVVFVLCVLLLAGLRLSAIHNPKRPAWMPANAVWRATQSESVRLLPHGDWVACWQQQDQDHCLLADAWGSKEYEGVFTPVPQAAPVPVNRLVPITSETISPWMWSNHAGRLVPVVQLADGTVLAPAGSTNDLREYVERIQKFSERLKPPPIYLEYHPAGTPTSHNDK